METVFTVSKKNVATPKTRTRPAYVHRLIRSRETRDYLSSRGWTADLSLATKYPSQMDALRACARDALGNVELVLCVPGSMTEIFATAVR